jgi:putative Holliday junction resolvase
MRILGLDLGDATIGVAVSDEMGWTAQGLTTIRRTSQQKDFEALGEVIRQYQPEQIILGLPRNIDGSIGPQARKVMEFTEQLSTRFSIPIIEWDERFSTLGAERYLLEAELSSRERKKVINKLAAAFILQGYLDCKSSP